MAVYKQLKTKIDGKTTDIYPYTSPDAVLNSDGTTLQDTLDDLSDSVNNAVSDIKVDWNETDETSANYIHNKPDLDEKANVDSPVLTGTPQAPTATAGTNTNQIATTAFVQNAVKTATEGLSTDTNTTYTLTKSGSTITLTGSDGSITTVEDTDTNTTYSHPSYTARTGVPTTNQTPTFGGTFNITQPVSDETGHITAMNDRTITIPNATATTDSSGLMSAADKALLGTQDISTIADGTITGAIIYLNNLSADLSNISDALDLINRTVI